MAHRTEEHIASVYRTVRQLVALDVRYGGNETARQAVPALSRAYGWLRAARYEADLCAAVAELAELTGWLLCDANRQAGAGRANRLALRLAQRCGHRSIELFVIHNMSLQATYLRQPRRAYEVLRPVLDGKRLTPRLHAMFQLRLARAHAQAGRAGDAFRALAHSRCLLRDGASDRDPPWAWWVSERGCHFATGAMYGTLGDWPAAVEPLHRALDAAPSAATRDRFLYLCALLHALIEVGAWHDARTAAGELAPLIDVVGSDRPLARLLATTEQPSPSQARARRLASAVEPIRETVPLFRERCGWRVGGRAGIHGGGRRPIDQIVSPQRVRAAQ